MNRLKQFSKTCLLFVLAGCIISFNTNATECDFQCTLQQHLDAIQSRDFEAFAATITEQPVLDFILPNGRSFTDRDEYLTLLEGWFQQEGWHFNYDIVRIIEGRDLAIAFLKVSYDEDDRGGEPYHIDHFLNLSFQKQSGEWRLVLDQNTLIQTDAQP